MSINLKKEQTNLNKRLEVVFANANLTNGLKTTNFQAIVEKEINIVIFLEKKNNTKTLKSKIWINALNNATGKTFVPNETINYKDSETLVDDINHLTVYVKNIYKFDLDAAVEGKQAQISTPNVSEVAEPNQKKSFADILPAMFGGAGANSEQFANLPPEQNPFYIQSANMRIQQEVKSGKLYLFKTKPRIIPFLKAALSLMLFLTGAAAIILAVGLILATTTQVGQFIGDKKTGVITDGVLVIILALMCIYLGVIVGIPLIKQIRKQANDNNLYFLDWRWLSAGAFTFCLVVMMLGINGDMSIIGVNSPVAHPNDKILWVGFMGIILLLSFAVLSIALVVVTVHFNPKQDLERIKAIAAAYIAEAAASKTGKTPPPSVPPIIN